MSNKKHIVKAEMLEWMFINDGNFKNVNEWREAFVSKLDELLENFDLME